MTMTHHPKPSTTSSRSKIALVLFFITVSLLHFKCVLALQSSPTISLGRLQHKTTHGRIPSLSAEFGSSRTTTTTTTTHSLQKVSTKPTSPRKQNIKTITPSSFRPSSLRQQTKRNARKGLKYIQSLLTASFFGASEAIRQSFWLFPMTLAVVPLYCIMLGTRATMPAWWPVETLDHLVNSPYAVAAISGFLLSNVFYFLSGLFMLDLIPLKRTFAESRIRKFSSHLASDPLLGVCVLTAGAVSTAYHSVQALGSYAVAQELSFIDHGVALSSGLYFLQRLGLPSWKTLAIGGAGLVSLANPVGGSYAGLHSLWHFLSASATVSWGFDGYKRNYLGDLE